MPAVSGGGIVTGRPAAGALRLLPAAAALVAAAVALGWFQVFDHDVFWHLSAGQLIARGGGLPDRNLFSSTFPDHPWPDPEWLFQVVIAWCFQAGGWLGVALFKVLVVCLIAVTVFATVLGEGAGAWTAAALAAGALAVMRLRLTERPHLLSYLLFAAVLGALARRGRGRPGAAWTLPPLFALWGNIHPELIVGLLFVGAVVVGEAVDRRRRGAPARERRDPLPLALGFGVAAALVNPVGWRVLQYPLLHIGIGSFIDLTEYRSSFGYPVPLFWFTLATLAATLALRRARLTLAETLPVGGLVVLAVLFQRTIPYVALAAAPLLGRHLGPGRRGQREAVRENPTLAAGAAAVLAWSLSFGQPPFLRPGHGVNQALFPVAAANFLAAEALPAKLYNPYGEGGYLIHRLWPRVGVFQDGRFVQAYPRSFFQRLALARSPGDWSSLLEAEGVSTALVRAGDLERMGFGNRAWAIVFWDDEWCVLVRRAASTASQLARLEYTAYLPGFPLPQAPAAREVAVREMRRNQQARFAPSAQVATDLGVTLALLHRFAEATAALREATALAPRSADAWAKLGFAYAAADDRASAVAALQTALGIDPGNEGARRTLAAVNGLPQDR